MSNKLVRPANVNVAFSVVTDVINDRRAYVAPPIPYRTLPDESNRTTSNGDTRIINNGA